MRRVFLLFLFLILSFALVACSSQPEGLPVAVESNTPTPTATPSPTPVPTIKPTPFVPEIPTPEPVNPYLSFLTGEETLSDAAILTRPVAVMVNNASDSLPQYGLSQADIIFEMPVEGNITRLMALYSDYTAVPDICAVRSCRYYYPIMSESFDAIYVHWGIEAQYAVNTLAEQEVDNYEGMYNPYGMFDRDYDRINVGYNYEHSSVFFGTQLPNALIQDGVRLELENSKRNFFFNFNEEFTPSNGAEIINFQFDFGNYYTDFTYDAENEVYLKMHNGEAHFDGRTNTQLSFTNVIVLENEVGLKSTHTNGIKDIDLIGNDKSGYYLSGGNVQKILWSKPDAQSSLILEHENGAPLYINTGKTYFAVGDIEYNSELFN